VEDSTRGKLLVATPVVGDFFHRTVVLVIEHSDEGAVGVVLNRPSDVLVADAVPVLAEAAGEDDLVHVGGPVATQSVLALGDFVDPDAAATPVTGSLGLVDPDDLAAELRRLRVYVGHAGWAPGQLDGELEAEAWIVEDARPDDPFQDEDVWPLVLRRKGGAYTLLSTMPEDPALN
jgi:putative transcriptional regulator